jgi:hypothetical protein
VTEQDPLKRKTVQREARRLAKLRGFRLVEQAPAERIVATPKIHYQPKDAA